MNKVAQRAGSALVIGALALGGAGTASAATTKSKSKSQASKKHKAKRHSSNSTTTGNGRHIGANGQQEQALADDVAQKVADAALAKVPGTVERTETDADHGSPYEAHVRGSDGKEYEVLVNENFEVTAVNEMGGDHHGDGSTNGSYQSDSGTSAG